MNGKKLLFITSIFAFHTTPHFLQGLQKVGSALLTTLTPLQQEDCAGIPHVNHEILKAKQHNAHTMCAYGALGLTGSLACAAFKGRADGQLAITPTLKRMMKLSGMGIAFGIGYLVKLQQDVASIAAGRKAYFAATDQTQKVAAAWALAKKFQESEDLSSELATELIACFNYFMLSKECAPHADTTKSLFYIVSAIRHRLCAWNPVGVAKPLYDIARAAGFTYPDEMENITANNWQNTALPWANGSFDEFTRLRKEHVLTPVTQPEEKAAQAAAQEQLQTSSAAKEALQKEGVALIALLQRDDTAGLMNNAETRDRATTFIRDVNAHETVKKEIATRAEQKTPTPWHELPDILQTALRVDRLLWLAIDNKFKQPQVQELVKVLLKDNNINIIHYIPDPEDAIFKQQLSDVARQKLELIAAAGNSRYAAEKAKRQVQALMPAPHMPSPEETQRFQQTMEQARQQVSALSAQAHQNLHQVQFLNATGPLIATIGAVAIECLL